MAADGKRESSKARDAHDDSRPRGQVREVGAKIEMQSIAQKGAEKIGLKSYVQPSSKI